MANSSGNSGVPQGISLSNTVHSEISPSLPLPSLPVFCGALDHELRLFDERSESRSLNRSDILIHANKIADLLHNTDVSYLNLRADASPQSHGFVGHLDLHNEVLTCNSEAFALINAVSQAPLRRLHEVARLIQILLRVYLLSNFHNKAL